jgi:glucose-6-phosphate isomerase
MPGEEAPPFESYLGSMAGPVRERLRLLAATGFVSRLWKRDPTLWKPDASQREVSAYRLGWLGSTGFMQGEARDLALFAEEAAGEGVTTIFLLGVGGSSLAAEALAFIFRAVAGEIECVVLDTIDPSAVLEAERSRDLRRSFFLVSSKSGTTTETLALHAHFRARLGELGDRSPGARFVALTDPGSPLEEMARAEGFRRIFETPADIGGRYAPLSFSGLVPAALMGVNLPRLLDRAARVSSACGPSRDLASNPGVHLGAILAEAAFAGRDKITLVLSPEIAPLGRWIEHLLAESTGKNGRGLLPVEGEALATPGAYGSDRLFVYLRLRGGTNQATDTATSALKEAGHPLVRIELEDVYDVGAEFLLWEIAVATIGAILEVNPFDEPDIGETNLKALELLQLLADEGRLPEREPFLREEELALHAAPDRSERLSHEAEGRGWPRCAAGILAAHLLTVSSGDFVAITAFLPRSPDVKASLQRARLGVRDALRVATTLGFGPGFLHAAGQYPKGGPDRGVFVQVTADDSEDLPIPGRPYTFGTLKRALAAGDLASLILRKRRALRVHLGGPLPAALSKLERAARDAFDLLRQARD